MTRLIVLVLAAVALAGCVVAPPAPANYRTQAYSQVPVDPHQWRVVSVEPVRRDAQGRIIDTPAPVYVYPTEPVYVPQPVYGAPQYYNPIPVSIGLNFGFGTHWGGGHRGHRGHRR